MGCCIWVRNQESYKLGGCISKWVLISSPTDLICIYWPIKRTISVEHDCYFNNITRSSEGLKGEEEGIVCRNIVSYASYGTINVLLLNVDFLRNM